MLVARPFQKFVLQKDHTRVPRDPAKNLDFREKLYDRCARDIGAQEAIREICEQDFLFWINAFCWVFEPRWKAMFPFATWDYQDEVFQQIFSNIGVSDISIEKSRDMGATWIVLSVFTYLFLYQQHASFGLVTRTEDLAIDKGDPDTLFWKVKYLIDGLPKWLKPVVKLKGKNFENETLGGVITGYSATGDVARGGRRLAFLADEAASFGAKEGYDAWASMQHVTDTRIAASTPKGNAGIFADINSKPNKSLVKIRLHWTQHPRKKAGLYTTEHGKVKILDKTYDFPRDYNFILDGRVRSPYYDKECNRHPSPVLIAQELDIDYGGSGSPFFDGNLINNHMVRYAIPPKGRYELEFDSEVHKIEFIPSKKGPFSTWYAGIASPWEPSHDNDYAFGCDVATGKGGGGATNSVCSVVNIVTGEKVAEFAANDIEPSDFAHMIAALRKVFRGPGGDAWVAHEANGPGQLFGKTLLRVSPGRIYMRRQIKKRTERRTDEPGWWSDRNTKTILLGEYQSALKSMKFINRSEVALDECRHYVYGQGGEIYHDRSKTDMETSNAGENHGDRVIADALAYRMAKSISSKKTTSITAPRSTSLMSFGGRLSLYQKKMQQLKKAYW